MSKTSKFIYAKNGNRYHVTLARVKYDPARFERAYNILKSGRVPDRSDVKEARQIARRLLRLKTLPDFFTSEGQHKMMLSNKASKGVLKSFVMHFAPGDLSGTEVCHGRSEGCTKSCLYESGHGSIVNVKAGRIKRTKLYFEHRAIFALTFFDMIDRLSKRSYKVAIRPNGTSDIVWESRERWMFSMFPDVIYYDYTKLPGRFKRSLPENYSLTFSRSETNHRHAIKTLDDGGNVAIVFDKATWKRVTASGSWSGYRVIDGTADDRRWLDPRNGCIVALKPLGPAKRDTSGFVLRPSLRLVSAEVAA